MENPINDSDSTKDSATLEDVARFANVAKSTVSLALRGDPRVAEDTRKRIFHAAETLSYRPNPLFSSLSAYRWHRDSSKMRCTLAWLSHSSMQGGRQHTVLRQAARQRAEELGYQLDTFYLDQYPDAEALSRVLYHRGIRGLIIPPIRDLDSGQAMHMKWDYFTAVCCGIGRARPLLHTISDDVFANVCMAWEIVAKAGFQRIGTAINRHNPLVEDDWRRIGASKASIELLNLGESASIPFLQTEVKDETALINWYHEHRPEVIIGFNHSTGEMLERNGIRIPEDVEFMCLMAPEGSKWSGIIAPYDHIARTAMEFLNNEIRENRWGLPENQHVILVEPQWNPGTTFLHY